MCRRICTRCSGSPRASTLRCAPTSTARTCAAPTPSAPASTTANCAWACAKSPVAGSPTLSIPPFRSSAPRQPAAPRHYLGIAGGSAITPILSLMKTALAREPRSRFTLIYGNRSLQSTMFREELQDLKNRYLARLALHHVFSAEQTDLPLNMGRIDHGKITAFLDALLPVRRIDVAFICGPFHMNHQVQAALLAAGLPAERIHVERFGL